MRHEPSPTYLVIPLVGGTPIPRLAQEERRVSISSHEQEVLDSIAENSLPRGSWFADQNLSHKVNSNRQLAWAHPWSNALLLAFKIS